MHDVTDKLIYKDGYFYFPDKKIKVKPPVTRNVFDEINKLKQEKLDLLMEYKDLYDKIIYSENHKTQYNAIIKQISDIEEQIEELYTYFNLVNEVKHDDKIDKLNKEIKYFKDNKKIKEYINKLTEKNTLLKSIPASNIIDFYVIEACDVKTEIPEKREVAPKPKEQAKKKLKEQPKEKTKELPKEEVEAKIKYNIKELLKEKFKFRTKDECSSLRRSQPYFMTKQDIVETIEGDHRLKSVMPEAYKALKKEEICDNLFKED